MSIQIEIKSIEVKIKSGISAKNGRPYSIAEQEAWAYTYDMEGRPHPYPQRIKLTLKGDQPQPYPLGMYGISPTSFFVDRFNGLEVGLILQPIKSASAPMTVIPAKAA